MLFFGVEGNGKVYFLQFFFKQGVLQKVLA